MQTIEQYLAERKAFVESHLFAALPGEGTAPQLIREAMLHAVKSGGKRLRPILCLAASEASGGNLFCAIPAACAIELLHTYTLVHDDLPCMDDDELRRGQPSVWKKYGEAIAVLAGDALQAQAFAQAAKSGKCEVVAELSEAASACGVIGGQVEDILFDGKTDLDMLKYIYRHKTGDLIRAACRMGALSAGAKDLDALTSYAEHLGNAFQIEDDLLDAKQSKSGDKPELSCLDLMTEEESLKWCVEETELSVAALSSLSGETLKLRELALHLISRKV